MPPQRPSPESRQPFALWLTGLPAAGKTTLAGEIAGRLRDLGLSVCMLDGDIMRRGLNADLGFSEAGRDENIRRAAEIAKLLLDSGIIVVTALISPFRAGRMRAREIAGAGRFLEVFVDAPLEVCRQRDPKGLYARAAAGEISDLTGVGSPYQPPLDPELHLRSDRDTPEALADEVIRYLRDQGRL
ncbi:MAG: adenylyl-sulfate kinase [Gammaproteobacteria bacterium]|nr:adenylyl-sulfate kinase [Gammaproteobacteria bacterium]MXW44929.1 adenylyl-sulfate kinase [Gammaproteobacteria bacterium]MYD01396.1 adenylyl-sulfate kinase [Gammaproteobacteria bacterium]MYI25296.1 adenylyl-sulfate kinase [Gammaproteobacteria bacterium]